MILVPNPVFVVIFGFQALNKQKSVCPESYMTEFDPEDGDQVGRALEGFGINLLVSSVDRTVKFLQTVFDFEVVSATSDYALLVFRQRYYQLHADHTYAENPLPSLVPESGPRGGGIELRLFEVDPDQSEARAVANDYVVLMKTADKPHGLRECFLLDPDGYCWVPSIKKKAGG